MGALMSIARVDPLKPMEGFAPGFEKWKGDRIANLVKGSPRESVRK